MAILPPRRSRPLHRRRGPSDQTRIALLATCGALLVANLASITWGVVGAPRRPAGVAVAGPPPATARPAPATARTPVSVPRTATAGTASRPAAGRSSAGNASPAAGRGPGTVSSAALAGAGCPAAACVTFTATRAVGPVDHAASGYNFVPTATSSSPYLGQLSATMYRSAPGITSSGLLDWTSWDAGAASSSHTMLILSDLWIESHPGGYPPTPWSNWSNYTEWVKAMAAKITASGRRVDYWEIYSEPGWRNVYSPSDFQSMTPDDLLQQFLVTYQAIKSVDPGAAIVGPSIGYWTLSPVPPDWAVSHEPDLATFLRFCSSHALQLAAVAWHDNSLSPDQMRSDADTTWNLIRSTPNIGQPTMFIDEYGSPVTQPVPGYDVAFMQLARDTGIASGVRSCWDRCSLSTLDGLLTSGGQPTSEFYVNRAYAQMRGSYIASSGTDPGLASLASIDPGSRQVSGLLGRWGGSSPESVHVSVVVPWSVSRVNLSLGCEPDAPGGYAGPIGATPANLSLQPAGAGHETVSFDIPDFAPGAAYSFTVGPA